MTAFAFTLHKRSLLPTVSPSILYSYTTISRLAKYILQIQSTPTNSESTAEAAIPIAIVGVGLRLPGNIVDMESLWDVLSKGGDTVDLLPERAFSNGM